MNAAVRIFGPRAAASSETRIGEAAEGKRLDALAAAALEPNPFYTHAFLEGSLALGERRVPRLIHAGPTDGPWLAALPVRGAQLAESGGLGVLKAWRNPYIMRSEPLLLAAAPFEAANALIAALAQNSAGQNLLHLPMLDLDGAVFAALSAAAQAQGRDLLIIQSHERAALRRGDLLAKDKLKNARRMLRRLQESGKLESRLAIGGAAATPMLEDFLTVEASGWKGREGTALACRPETLAFARRAFDPVRSSTLFDGLYLDGRPIALNVNLRAGQSCMTVKSGYDEAFRQYSPGVVLDTLFSEAALEGRYGAVVDSVSMPGHNLERLWPGRIRVGSVLIDIAERPSPRGFALKAAGISQFLALRETAKTQWLRLRRS